jgi:MFS family permease
VRRPVRNLRLLKPVVAGAFWSRNEAPGRAGVCLTVAGVPDDGESMAVGRGRVATDGRSLRIALVALCVTEVTSWGVLYYTFPVVADAVSDDTGWSRSAIAAAFSVSQLVAATAGVPVGRWLDRHGPRPVMSAGSLLAAPAVVAVAMAPNLALFFAAWIVAGVAMSAVLYQPAFAALTRWYGERRVTALTTLTLAAGFSSAVFAPLAGFLLVRTDWRETYLLLAALLAVVTIPLHTLLLRPAWPARAVGGQPSIGRAAIFRTPAFRRLALAFAVGSFAAFSVVFSLVPLLTGRGLSTEVAAVALGLGGVGQVLGRLVYRRLAVGTSVRGRTALLFAAQGAAILVLGVVPGPAALLIVLTVVVGAVRGLLTLLQATAVSDRWGVHDYAALSGVLGVAVTGAMALAPWGAAATASLLGGYPAAMAAFAVLCGIAAALGWSSVPGREPAEERPLRSGDGGELDAGAPID